MLTLKRHAADWRCLAIPEKLNLRAGLPGAFAYDAVVRGALRARVAGVAMTDQLASAFAASWLVNGGTPSPVFRRWLTPPFADVWTEIAETLVTDPWGSLEVADRTTIASALGAIMIDGQGVGPVSKALAVLAPHAVPLMPDAALSFATGGATRVPNADAQTAGVLAFAPMMDWFSEQVTAGEAVLARVADDSGGHLVTAQVLDRALWFDSAGYMYFKGWYWVRDGEREAVAKLSAPYEGAARATAIDLRAPEVPPPFRDEALRALDG